MTSKSETSIETDAPDRGGHGVHEKTWQKPLTRGEAASYLIRRFGFGSTSTLSKAAMDGSGPPFFKTRGGTSNGRSFYRTEDLDAWAIAKLGEARTSFRIATQEKSPA